MSASHARSLPSQAREIIMDTSDFPALMQTPPQELFDKIYHLVFHIQCGRRAIDAHYTFPVQLLVDNLSRDNYACGYYGRGWPSRSTDACSIAGPWPSRLSTSTRSAISTILFPAATFFLV